MNAPKHYADRPTIAQYLLRILGFLLIVAGIAVFLGAPSTDVIIVASGPTAFGWTNWMPLTGNLVHFCIALGLITALIGMMIFRLFGADPIARRQIHRQRRIEKTNEVRMEAPDAEILLFPVGAHGSRTLISGTSLNH